MRRAGRGHTADVGPGINRPGLLRRCGRRASTRLSAARRQATQAAQLDGAGSAIRMYQRQSIEVRARAGEGKDRARCLYERWLRSWGLRVADAFEPGRLQVREKGLKSASGGLYRGLRVVSYWHVRDRVPRLPCTLMEGVESDAPREG